MFLLFLSAMIIAGVYKSIQVKKNNQIIKYFIGFINLESMKPLWAYKVKKLIFNKVENKSITIFSYSQKIKRFNTLCPTE